MSKVDYEDIPVSKGVILEYLGASIKKSAFHDWVKRGRIKSARDLPGYYLLNATLVHQGLPPVDVKPLREKRRKVERGLKNRQLLYLAAKKADPLYGENLPTHFNVPEVLADKEIETIADLERQIIKSADFTRGNPLEKSAYRLGLLSALEHMAYLDSLEE